MGETLTQDQKVEMHAERRKLHSVGDASGAASITQALLDERFFMGLKAVPEPEVKQPKPNAKAEAWVRFALEVSDMDPEIINGAKRNDLIKMLKANGLIE